MRWIDLPPVWLLAALAVAWLWRWPAAWSGSFWPGLICLALAVALFLGALLEFVRVGTTIVPRRDPSGLITGGIFRLSRNPIYLADALVLAGFSLIWGSLPGLALTPALFWLLRARFILGEEARLSEAFGQDYEDYRRRVRRWI